jgi:hypothetical protein
MDRGIVGGGRGVWRSASLRGALFASSVLLVVSCSGDGGNGDDDGNAGDGGSGGSGNEAVSGGGQISTSGASGGTSVGGMAGAAAGASQGGTPPAQAGATSIEGGAGGAEAAGSGGSSSDEGLLPSADVAAACATPLSSSLSLDSSSGWRIAALRIDATRPSCALVSVEEAPLDEQSALSFVHESDGSYSIWSSFPWSYEVEAGGESNNLPEDQSITVFPFLETVKLRVVFSFSEDTVTVTSVAPE